MAKEISLESLGLSQDALIERLVEKIASNVLEGIQYDEDGAEWFAASPFAKKLDKLVKDRLDKAVTDMANKHVLPNVEKYVETLTLQKTNEWGEKRGEKLTFVEYLVQRCHEYMVEEVNHEGKNKKQSDSYSWRPAGTRIAYQVDKYLQYSIDSAMKQALADANSKIVEGLNQAVKIKLTELSQALKVAVTTR